ncbi:hypothetical protein AAMO2058_000025500 [Amorphochlora amoebiformis]
MIRGHEFSTTEEIDFEHRLPPSIGSTVLVRRPGISFAKPRCRKSLRQVFGDLFCCQHNREDEREGKDSWNQTPDYYMTATVTSIYKDDIEDKEYTNDGAYFNNREGMWKIEVSTLNALVPEVYDFPAFDDSMVVVPNIKFPPRAGWRVLVKTGSQDPNNGVFQRDFVEAERRWCIGKLKIFDPISGDAKIDMESGMELLLNLNKPYDPMSILTSKSNMTSFPVLYLPINWPSYLPKVPPPPPPPSLLAAPAKPTSSRENRPSQPSTRRGSELIEDFNLRASQASVGSIDSETIQIAEEDFGSHREARGREGEELGDVKELVFETSDIGENHGEASIIRKGRKPSVESQDTIHMDEYNDIAQSRTTLKAETLDRQIEPKNPKFRPKPQAHTSSTPPPAGETIYSDPFISELKIRSDTLEGQGGGTDQQKMERDGERKELEERAGTRRGGKGSPLAVDGIQKSLMGLQLSLQDSISQINHNDKDMKVLDVSETSGGRISTINTDLRRSRHRRNTKGFILNEGQKKKVIIAMAREVTEGTQTKGTLRNAKRSQRNSSNKLL